MDTTFDTWLAEQFAKGLVDIKFAVIPGRGVSVEAIQGELLAAEVAWCCWARDLFCCYRFPRCPIGPLVVLGRWEGPGWSLHPGLWRPLRLSFRGTVGCGRRELLCNRLKVGKPGQGLESKTRRVAATLADKSVCVVEASVRWQQVLLIETFCM